MSLCLSQWRGQRSEQIKGTAYTEIKSNNLTIERETQTGTGRRQGTDKQHGVFHRREGEWGKIHSINTEVVENGEKIRRVYQLFIHVTGSACMKDEHSQDPRWGLSEGDHERASLFGLNLTCTFGRSLSLSLSLPQNITDAWWGLYGVRWWIKKKEKSVVLSFALSHFLSLCVSTSFYIYISFYLSLSLSHSFNQLSFTRILALSLSFLSLSLALVCVTRGVWVPSGSISHQVMAAILETTHPK